MTSAVYPIRNEAHWSGPRVYSRKYTNNNHIPNQLNTPIYRQQNPNCTQNPNPSFVTNHYITPNTTINPLIRRNEERFSSVPAAAAVSESRTVNIEDDFSPGEPMVFHVGTYLKSELRKLRTRFVSELQRVKELKQKIEARELELRSTNRLVEINNAAAGTTTPPPLLPPGGPHKKKSGQKRKMPALKGRGGAIRPVGNGNSNSSVDKAVSGMMRKCGQILAKLMKHKHGWVFNKPVNAAELGLHNYHTIIKHPMDLGTVKMKLGKRMYRWPLDFAADVRLTFDNAMTYNVKGDIVYTMANDLLKLFDESFDPAYKRFLADHQRILAAAKLKEPVVLLGALPQGRNEVVKCQPVVMQKEPLVVDDTTIQVVVPEPVTTVRESNVVEKKQPKTKEEEGRTEIVVMSNDERDKLGLLLQDLPGEYMDHVLNIVRKRNPGMAAPDMDGEVELDIQALDNATMWELDKFVKLVNNEASAATSQMNMGKTPQVVDQLIQEAPSVAMNKGDEDIIDIGDEMPMNYYPPIEIEKDDDIPTSAVSGKSRSSGSSGSENDSSSSSDSDSDSSSSSGSDSDADS